MAALPAPRAPHDHYPLRIADRDVCTCDLHWMMTLELADADPVEPIDLAAEAERRRQALRNVAARRARRMNREAGAR